MAALGGVGSLGFGLAIATLPIAFPTGLAMAGSWAWIAWSRLRPLAKVRVGGGGSDGGPVIPEDVAVFRLGALRSMRLLPDEDELGFLVEVKKGIRKAAFRGEDARRVAAALVPRLNREGGSRRSVQRAVKEIEAAGHPNRFLTEVASRASSSLGRMPVPVRLALEMSLHEEQERRSIEGELWILERAWREAEEIAAIADSLLLPANTDAFFDRHGDDR
ncbi:MAG: hypothetical protein F4151_14320 [Gammaproteobacteria bacterium]|nr:hypothetical protein [Gammaproteobacteria bacterium]